jgi:DNA-binding CsgD family transcriptional regulator
MSALTVYDPEGDRDEEDGVTPQTAEAWEMKSLKPRHKAIASFIAQGLSQVEIAKVMDITPQYVSMLSRQALMKQEIQRICEVAGTRMEALYQESVEVVADTLKNGNTTNKLKAAKLQMEATNRIGNRGKTAQTEFDSSERLLKLSERLVDLLGERKRGRTFNESGEEIQG